MIQTTSSIVLLARITRWATGAAIVIGTVSWLWASVARFAPSALPAAAGLHTGGFTPASNAAHALYIDFPVAGWAIGSLGLAVTGFGLVRIIQLMRIYETGVVFDKRASYLLSSFAAAIFLRELIDVVLPAALAIAAHWKNGSTPVTFALGASQGHVLFITLVFLLIAKIMAVGHRLADDNAKII